MELDDYTSILARIAFFEICTSEQQRLLAFASEQRQFRTGDVLYAEGAAADGSYILVRGAVDIYDDQQSRAKSYRVSGPDSMIGELALVLDRPRRKTVVAASTVDTLFVPRMAFVKLMRQYPEMAERAAERIGNELDSYLGMLDPFRPRPSQSQ